MAKKKEALIEEPVAEEVIEVVEKEETPKEAPLTDTERFIYAQLKIINEMNNPAKAKRLAERVLRNRKGN